MVLDALVLLGCTRADDADRAAADDTAPPRDTSVEDTADSGGEDTDSDPAPLARSCGLVATFDAPWFSEGEDVRFAVACTGELPTAEAFLSSVSLPEGASFDPATRTVVWQTDGGDGGTWDLGFAASDAAAPGTTPELSTVRIWVADDPSAPSASPPDRATYTEEWGLPVFHVDTGVLIGQEYVPAQVVFDGKPYEAWIKVRGASSSAYPKPGYTLEFDKDELDVGWEPDDRDHILLVSTFDDNSAIRQKLVYDQWAAIADYWGEDRLTPRTFFAVLYLDGAYQGLFMALDRIDDEFIRHMGFDASGNLYKGVSHDANFYATRASGQPKASLAEGYTKEEGLPASDTSDLRALVQFTSTSDDAALWAGARDWFRTDEFMDWFLLVSFALAEDSGGKNAYLYHEPTLDRFLFCPWDFNNAWGQSWYTTRTSSSTLQDFRWTNRVFDAFLDVPAADAELWGRFAAMRADGPFSPAWLHAQVDTYEALIAPSARRDEEKWRSAYQSYWWAPYRADDWTDWDGEMAYIRTWIDERDALYRTLVP